MHNSYKLMNSRSWIDDIENTIWELSTFTEWEREKLKKKPMSIFWNLDLKWWLRVVSNLSKFWDLSISNRIFQCQLVFEEQKTNHKYCSSTDPPKKNLKPRNLPRNNENSNKRELIMTKIDQFQDISLSIFSTKLF